MSRNHLDCGGIALRFILPDIPPYRDLRFTGGVGAIDSAPELIVRVLRPEEPASETSFGAWIPVDGAGEYEAACNYAASRAWVRCVGENPCAALANFTRRLLMERIPVLGGVVLHSACVARSGHAYLFAGKSGAGKSTACALSVPALIVADDLSAVRIKGDGADVWGLPEYDGVSGAIRAPGPFRLAAIFRLVKAAHPALSRLSVAEAIAGLMALPSGPEGNALAATSLAALEALMRLVPCYELRFRKDPSFWACIDDELIDIVRRNA